MKKSSRTLLGAAGAFLAAAAVVLPAYGVTNCYPTPFVYPADGVIKRLSCSAPGNPNWVVNMAYNAVANFFGSGTGAAATYPDAFTVTSGSYSNYAAVFCANGSGNSITVNNGTAFIACPAGVLATYGAAAVSIP
jgi:hypothetical protein